MIFNVFMSKSKFNIKSNIEFLIRNTRPVIGSFQCSGVSLIWGPPLAYGQWRLGEDAVLLHPPPQTSIVSVEQMWEFYCRIR
ncbi:hypothetical protein GDO81_010683 [Engystomops pustulosus]|uniref:Uncharacterized protein n=1 Tax=Engystomops pustulosus TaxID=76066 RepID=A0AAV7C207_ENGPU|nr:hypothetical protein GDO81_010683 [Engystomops pustulosus]